MSRRSWTVVLTALIAVVYVLVAIEAARCRVLLVNDYIAFSMIRIGAWPWSILRSIFDLSYPGAWLFRPVPDALAWLLATLFRDQLGVWHLVMIGVRLVSVALAYAVAKESASSPAAIAAGTAYFAFFPSIPEIDLLRAENWLVPALAGAFLGWLRLSRGRGSVAWAVAAFVIATMSKEIAAPLCLALFALLAPLLWRRGVASRLALGLMLVSLLNQIARCVLMASDPYARGSGSLLDRLPAHAFWTAKVLLLAATSFPVLSLLLATLIALGSIALLRRSRGSALMLMLAIGMAVAAPYPALRYSYPAALFLVPCVALGVDEIRRLTRDRIAETLAAVTLVLMAVFGGASLWAQAVAMRVSTHADWRLLNELAGAYASGRDVVVIEDADFERSFWMRAELAGVDPRWPFLSYVAGQYAAQKPVVWPKSPGGAVNLTGLVPAQPRARFLMVHALSDVSDENAIVVSANPKVGFHGSDAAVSALGAFARLARLANPRFHYAVDLGESPFPGHYWVILSSSRRISRAGVPPTSVNGGTSRVTTDPAATTAPVPR